MEANKNKTKSLTLEEEVRYLREREAAIMHFIYGIAVGFIIFWVVTFERQTD